MEPKVSKAGVEVVHGIEVISVDVDDVLGEIVCVGSETTVCFISRHIKIISRELIQAITCGLPVQSQPAIDGCHWNGITNARKQK